MSKKKLIIIVILVLVIALGGILYFILRPQNANTANNNNGASSFISSDYDSGYAQEDVFADGVPNLEVKFGYDGKTFTATMENNDTAIELVRNITSSGRNLPIYNYDNFEGYEYFQYYDIPSRYKIPSNPTTVTEEKAGEIYYSSPNRVIIFYRDANIEGQYTKIGQIQDTTGLRDAVENNPVLEGWGNKIISINYNN